MADTSRVMFQTQSRPDVQASTKPRASGGSHKKGDRKNKPKQSTTWPRNVRRGKKFSVSTPVVLQKGKVYPAPRLPPPPHIVRGWRQPRSDLVFSEHIPNNDY